MQIKIIELTAEADMLSMRAVRAIKSADRVVLQSEQAECAGELAELNKNIVTLDDLFESAEDFDALYISGAARISDMANKENAVFCILGDAGTNGFVRELQRSGASIEYVSCGAGVSAAVTAARAFMCIGEYAVTDARELAGAGLDTSNAIVITNVDNAITAEYVKCALCEYYAEETVGLLYAGGVSKQVKLYDFDKEPALGTGGIFVLEGVPIGEKQRYGLYDLVRIMAVLRGEGGCPWDREQTHESLRQYVIEEAYEAADAVDAEDMNALYDELGDVFLQVVFHAQIGQECKEFDIDDVASAVCEKMIRRHPHIFGDVKADTPEQVVTNWEAIKRQEKKNEDFVSVLMDVPRCMGAMMRAYKLQKKASAIGFDWQDAEQAFLKVEEEKEEWKRALAEGTNADMEGEAGDLIFSVINVLRLKKTNPELCLNRTCEKFIARMEYMEKNAEKELHGLNAAELDELWERAKQEKACKIGKNDEK
ncbi:MAG: nucleoside triphosphate pyrophosphohydrolase [Christensenella sp.]